VNIQAKRSRFLTLDGLRGFAAVCVALFHYDHDLMPGGYLAVDFFFALSGFVLTKTYTRRFAAGLSKGAFFKQRAVRLFPLFWLGMALGTVLKVQQSLRHSHDFIPIGHLIPTILVNVLMLPSPFSQLLFPTNIPSWSLFMEFVANIALAVFLIKLGRGGLAIFAAIAAMGFAFFAWHIQFSPQQAASAAQSAAMSAVDQGADWAGVHIGLLRTAYAFTAGVFIARLPALAERHASVLAAGLWLVLLAALGAGVGGVRFEYDLAFALLGAPLLVWLGSRVEPPSWCAGFGEWLGGVSYALYAVHGPITILFGVAARHFGLSLLWLAPVYVGAILGVAALAVRFVDEPARRVINRWLNTPQPLRRASDGSG
jgi:peptidoglycan/LPS O-acetylase OafA/YrhL